MEPAFARLFQITNTTTQIVTMNASHVTILASTVLDPHSTIVQDAKLMALIGQKRVANALLAVTTVTLQAVKIIRTVLK